MRYTLRQLEVFIATAHHGNVTRAAASLALSQSAASGALLDLERQFDVKLFDRVGKRVQLSELGAQLRPAAESLLAQAREFESAMAGGDLHGRLEVGATLTIGNYLAVGLIADFRRMLPGAEVGLQVANTESIVARVLNYELDVGLIEGELQHPDLEILSWRHDELVVFCAPEHPAASKPALTDQDLRLLKWVVREPGSGTRQTFDRAMHGILAELEITLELQHTEAIKRAVEARLGVGCLSRIALADAFRRGALVPLAVPGRDFRRRFSIILHRRKYHGRLLSQWLRLCREQWSD
jgi:DNA-binding transcriptional LysR family regulator